MTVTINLPPDKEEAFKAQARARGLSVEQWLVELAESAAGQTTASSQNVVDVCAMVAGLAEDVDFSRNPSRSRAVDL